MTDAGENPHPVPKNAGVIAPPPLLALAALVIGVAASFIWPLGLLNSAPPLARWMVGGVLVATAVWLELAGTGRFRKADTSVKPWEATSALVTDGIFAHLRNPMYVGFFLILTGIALIGGFDWLIASTIALALVIHWGVVRREERYLDGLFGEEYRAYKASVPRYGWRF